LPLTPHGKNIHQSLLNKAARHFSKKGYTIIKEARISGRNRIDLLAIKDSERIGIECQLTISYGIIKQKFRDYGSDLTRMLFLVPLSREAKMKNVLNIISKEEKLSKNFFDIWTENIDVGTSIRISKKTKARLDEWARKTGPFGESYDDVIRRLVHYYLNHRKVKK